MIATTLLSNDELSRGQDKKCRLLQNQSTPLGAVWSGSLYFCPYMYCDWGITHQVEQTCALSVVMVIIVIYQRRGSFQKFAALS